DLEIKPLFWLNMLLVFLLISLVSYYVFVSNTLASQHYRIRVMSEELTGLQGEQDGLKKSGTADLNELTAFARTHNMVEAGEVAHVSETSNVALVK
ncbi:MAG: hypothetical protein KW806_03220, partial [Candidatus Yanofskybacteria bacterium]|nr:hypothetical protein [Candidatus Yanofskybacteria bacterium]